MLEYPKYVYASDGVSRLVQSVADEADLGPGWFEDPGCVTPTVSAPPVEPEADPVEDADEADAEAEPAHKKRSRKH